MIPAFSPGPCNTSLLRVGNRFRCTREDLYEQCSLHITLKMPSSVRVGSRPPSSCLIFSYSSGVRPCSRIISGVTAGIAEVVITGKLYCRILGEFLAGRSPIRGIRTRNPEVWIKTDVNYRTQPGNGEQARESGDRNGDFPSLGRPIVRPGPHPAP